jgi:preprotein translocase subunit SecA
LIPSKYFYQTSAEPVKDDKVVREAHRLQRIVEGQHFDIRSSLGKYTVILQEQSEYIRAVRYRALTDDLSESFYFKERFPKRYASLVKEFGKEFINGIERQVILRVINQCWADYLDNMSYVKDSIHIMKMSGKDPLLEYNRVLFDSFYQLKDNIKEQICQILETIPIDENGIDLEAQGFPKPASTWTYIVSNTADQLSLFPFLDSLMRIAKHKRFD